MAKITTLFIDKGGVLLDNTVLSPQYRRLLGEYLSTELGGEPDAWANANVARPPAVPTGSYDGASTSARRESSNDSGIFVNGV